MAKPIPKFAPGELRKVLAANRQAKEKQRQRKEEAEARLDGELSRIRDGRVPKLHGDRIVFTGKRRLPEDPEGEEP